METENKNPDHVLATNEQNGEIIGLIQTYLHNIYVNKEAFWNVPLAIVMSELIVQDEKELFFKIFDAVKYRVFGDKVTAEEYWSLGRAEIERTESEGNNHVN